MNEPQPRMCPTCSVQVPPKTGKYCPACGSEMDAAALAPSGGEPAAVADAPAPAEEQPRVNGLGYAIGGGASADSGAGSAAGSTAAPNAAPNAAMNAAPSEMPHAGPLAESHDFELEEAPKLALPIAFAAAGALLGALLWAGIASGLGMELGYAAWAVGALAGGGMVLGGGRGVGHAVLAALLAFGGIVGGKFYGTHLLIEHQLRKVEEMAFTPAAFERMREVARQMAASPSPAGELMAEFGEGTQFSDEQLDYMDETLAAEARRFSQRLDEEYTYEMWRDEQVAQMRSQVSVSEVVGESLGAMDLLFVLLGLASAFGAVQRAAQRA